MAWRAQLKNWIDPDAQGDIYHFGIWFGDSLINVANGFQHPENFRHIAFDSFEGLPLDPNEPLWHPQWHPETGHMNAYSAKTWAETSDVDVAVEQVRQYIERKTSVEFQLIPGFFNNSLKPELVKDLNLKPAVYIDVDCDIYTSTIECLTFMLENKLIVPGTVLGFDDWKCTPNWEICQTGESRAWKELQETFGVASHYLYENYDGLQNWIVQVDDVA